MLTSLEVVKTVVQNRVVEDAMEEVKRGVRRGRDLARPLREAGIFPPLLIHMTELGQRSGEIEPMMLRIADTYDEDVELSVEAVVGVIQPIIILVMGGFVMYLVVSILLPILEMSQGFASR
jgi:general secretion pathway protein F